MSSEDPNPDSDRSRRGDANGRHDGGGAVTRRADQVACTELVLEVTPNAAIVSNLGVASYVLAGVADRPRNFYCWGSMGLTTSIGLGLALANDDPVTVLEGDGSLCMSLGALSTVATQDPENLAIVVWDNEAYATTGGQPVPAVDYEAVARACGLWAATVAEETAFEDAYAEAIAHDGAALLVCAVEPTDPDARPPFDYAYVKRRFRDALVDD